MSQNVQGKAIRNRICGRLRFGSRQYPEVAYESSEGNSDCSALSSGTWKFPRPTPTKRNLCCALTVTLSRRDSAILMNSSHDAGGEGGVWLQVSIRNSAVFS